jgi:serine/threonine protein kinase
MSKLPSTHNYQPPLPPSQEPTLPPPPPAEAPTPTPRLYGRYVLVQEHARGGLGKVSLALDAKLYRTVALKEIRPDRAQHPETVARFVNEAAITGRLEHPGIVPIYTLDEDAQGKPYYAMRFIQGRPMTAAIAEYHALLPSKEPARSPQLLFRELLQRFIAVCQAVAFAHSKSVLHRDLKPDNIISCSATTARRWWSIGDWPSRWRGCQVVRW